MPTGKNKKAIASMKDELGGRIMIEFIALRPKTFAYQIDDDDDDDNDDDDGDDDDSQVKKSKRNKEMCDKKRT